MSKNWSEMDIEYLKDSLGLVQLPTIAKNLNKSNVAVIMKMKRLGIGNTRIQAGYLTLQELANHLHVDRTVVSEWTKRHGLPYIRRITHTKRHFYFVDPEEFWKWAFQHKDKVQFNHIEPHTITPEPDWVNIERRTEHEQNLRKKRKYRHWSTLEDSKLKALRSKGKTFKQIGEDLSRSAVSVERRYNRIKDQ